MAASPSSSTLTWRLLALLVALLVLAPAFHAQKSPAEICPQLRKALLVDLRDFMYGIPVPNPFGGQPGAVYQRVLGLVSHTCLPAGAS